MQTWRGYASKRGMSPWRDVVDWVGGYPFAAAFVPGGRTAYVANFGSDSVTPLSRM